MAADPRRKRLQELLALAGVRLAPDVAAAGAAFVHQSHAREIGIASNQRLEFLGDSILGALAAGWLYEHYPDEPEGELTVRKASIVNDAQLARTARRLGFSELVLLGAGMRASGGAENPSILADAFEAFVGALYVRYGIERARRFVIREHIQKLQHESGGQLDPKTRLQHLAQAQLGATPTYVEESQGTPQHPAFVSRVAVGGKTLGTGSGSSKKVARQAAAREALRMLEAPELSNSQ